MKKLLLALITLLPAALSAQSFVATFTFDSVTNQTGRVDPTPFPVVPNVVFDSVRAVNLSANSTASVRFSYSGWPLGATAGSTDYSAMTGTVDTAKYFQVGIGPAAGYLMTIDSISFRFQRSGTGVRTYVVRGSEDGYASNLPAVISPANPKLSVQANNVFFMNFDSTAGQNGSMVHLFNDTAYADEDDASYFRFYAYNAEGNLGTFSIDNLTFYGTVSTAIGIATVNSGKGFIYPNPVSSEQLTVTAAEDRSELNILDLSGKLILSRTINAGSNVIDLSKMAAGTYIVRLTGKDTILSEKIIKN